MENDQPANASEVLFEKLNKVIMSWFTLMQKTVWVLTIFLAAFAFIGIAFFGYNMRETQKELKVRLQEFEKSSKELQEKAAEVDRLKLQTEDELERIAARYNKNFEVIRKELTKKTTATLSGDIVPYTPPIKPRRGGQ